MNKLQLLTPLLFVLSALGQSTWCVDVNGVAPGAGTQLGPYTSIQHAVNRPTTVKGDLLVVQPGLYVEKTDFGSKRLRLESAQGPRVTELRAPTAGPVVRSLIFNSGPWLEVTGFTISGTPGLGTVGVFASQMRLRRCVVQGHVRQPGVFQSGVGVHNVDSMSIEECTIIENVQGVTPDAFGANLTLRNSIVLNNEEIDLDLDGQFGETALYSLWGSANAGFPAQGDGNLSGEASFWNPEQFDYSLRPGSICIDAGDPTSPLDPDGSRRDIGALTYDSTYAPPPTVYCTAKVNSLGCTPAISSSGSASASGAPFTISCSNQLNQRPGLMFWGFAPKDIGYQGGYLCVQAPVRRTSLFNSGGNAGPDDCSGLYSVDFDAYIGAASDPALVAGSMVYAQFWSRDPGVSFSTVRSDALRFGIAP